MRRFVFIYNFSNKYIWAERTAQLLRHETSCFEPPHSGFTLVQFPVKIKLWMSRSSTNVCIYTHIHTHIYPYQYTHTLCTKCFLSSYRWRMNVLVLVFYEMLCYQMACCNTGIFMVYICMVYMEKNGLKLLNVCFSYLKISLILNSKFN